MLQQTLGYTICKMLFNYKLTLAAVIICIAVRFVRYCIFSCISCGFALATDCKVVYPALYNWYALPY